MSSQMNLSNINSHALSESIMRGEYSFMEAEFKGPGSVQSSSSNSFYGKGAKGETKPGKSKFFKKTAGGNSNENQIQKTSEEFTDWEGESSNIGKSHTNQ